MQCHACTAQSHEFKSPSESVKNLEAISFAILVAACQAAIAASETAEETELSLFFKLLIVI